MAIEFPGSAFFIVGGWPVPSATTGLVTVSLWWIPDLLLTNQRLWGSGDNMEGRQNVDDTFESDIFESSPPPQSTTLASIGTLFHVVITGDANTNTSNVYIDGVLEATTAGAVGATVGTTLHVCNRQGAANSDAGVGTMEDWRSYDRVLSPEEVATVYAARGVDGIVDGLTARYEMNELDDGTAATAASIVDSGPLALNTVSVIGAPVYRPSMLRFRRKVL